MEPGEFLFGAVGVTATLLGVGLLVAPGTVNVGPVRAVTDTAGSTEPAQLMLVLGTVAGLLVAVAARPRSGEESEQPTFETAAGRSDEGSNSLSPAAGTAIREGGEHWAELRATLAVAATDAYADAAGVSRSTAETAVARGSWTDDPLAAGVLAGELPVTAAVAAQVLPRRERQRRAERTVTAIERLQDR